MFTTHCPRCQSELSIPLEYEGENVQCTVCEHVFIAIMPHVSPTGKAGHERKRQRELETPNAVPPTQTDWTKAKNDAFNEIASLEERLNECQAHMDEYPCSYCHIWVKPFFDYERVSSGGVGLTNQYGVTLVRQNVSTRERIRCRQCGKLLGASGAVLARECSVELRATQSRLARFEREERRWLELRELATTRPILAAFLGYWGLFVAAIFVISILIFFCVLVWRQP